MFWRNRQPFPFDDDDEDFIPPGPRRVDSLPDDLMLVGETADKTLLPLQVDSDNRLALELATYRYLPALPVPIGGTNTDLIDGECVVAAVLLTNTDGSDRSCILRLSDGFDIYRGFVPAHGSVSLDFALLLDEGQSLQGRATTANAIKAFVVAHRVPEYVR